MLLIGLQGAASRSRSASRIGGAPKSLLYSRVNCDARGQTVVDHPETTLARGCEPNVEVVEEASRGRFLRMVYEAVRA
jgi:hypothetical protein